MASDKKSFLLYCDLIHTFNKLTNEEAGVLIKHIFSYVNDENPQSEDRLLNIVFEPIKQSLKRDLVKYEDIRGKKSLAGIKSAELRKQRQQNPTPVESVEQKQQVSTNSTVIVSVSDSVSDSVPVKEISFTDIEKKAIYSPESFPTWGIEASKFLKDDIFKKSFGSAKHLSFIEVEKHMTDFVVNLNLKQDYKDCPALKRHFTNHYKKHFEGKDTTNGSLSKGFIEVPKDIDYSTASWEG